MSNDVRSGGSYIDVFVMTEKAEAQLRGFQGKMRNFSGKLRSLGAPLVGIGASAATGITAAMTVFAKFEASMDAVKAKIGEVSDADFGRLESKAKQLGASTRYSASQVADAMVQLAAAGMTTDGILSAIGPTLNAPTADGMELARAADIASDVTTAMGYSADKTAQIIDLLAQASSSSATNIDMMGETFKVAAPLAATAGQTMEEMAAGVALLAKNGIKASLAGTDLAGIMNMLPNKKAMFDELGVAVADTEGHIRPLSAVMRDLGQATADMTDIDRMVLFEEIFGRYKKSVFNLTSQTDIYDELIAKMDNANGAAQRMATTMGDNIQGKVAGVVSAAEAVGIAFGEVLAGGTGDALVTLAEFLRTTAEWVSEHPGFVKSLVTVAGVLGTVGAFLMSASVALSVLSSGASVAITIWGGASTALTALGGSATIASVGLSAMGAALGVVMAIGFAAWIYSQMSSIKDFNAALEKSKELSEKLAEVTSRRQDKKIQKLDGLQGDERATAIEAEKDKNWKNLLGTKQKIAAVEARIAEYSTAAYLTGNKMLALEKEELAELKAKQKELNAYGSDLAKLSDKPAATAPASIPSPADIQLPAALTDLKSLPVPAVPNVAPVALSGSSPDIQQLTALMLSQQQNAPTSPLSPETATNADIVKAVNELAEKVESLPFVRLGEGN